jgi:23S rRNA (cytidine1920-2'-O)/16S rRNA (cytidine1409-2'-O)-methyltransferase
MTQGRLDHALVGRQLAPSKSKAQALIEGGCVQINGVVARKSSKSVSVSDIIEVTAQDHPWVSRGGLKLAHALAYFKLNVSGAVALDVGTSTGGFTDVLLQNGAQKVFAVDVGTDQLHASLRANARVVAHEQTNARDLNAELISEPIDIIVCDASFISLEKVLPAALALARDGAQLITLSKPQVEVGKERLGKGGVVKDVAQHAQVCEHIEGWIVSQGWHARGLTESPIFGPKGNKEFLLWAQKSC